MVEYLCGRAGSGKTALLLNKIEEASRLGERALVLVPEQMTLSMELALTRRLPVLWKVEVLSPSSLLRRLREEGGASARVVLDESGRAMALRRALEELRGSLRVFRRGGEGFVARMAALLEELRAAGLDSTALRLAADGLEVGVTQEKLYDIAAILDGYAGLLRGKYLDGDEAVALFAEQAGASGWLKDFYAFADGFDVPPPRTVRILGALARHCKGLCVSFKMDGDFGRDEKLFSPVSRAYEGLHRYVLAEGLLWRKQNLPPRAAGKPSLAHLERELYARPALPFAGRPEGLHIATAHDAYAEAERAAGFLLRLAMEKGYKPSEMAILCADLAPYGEALKSAFAQRGLPLFVDEPLSCAFHPAARYLLEALEAIARGLPTEGMIRCLKTGFSPLTETEQDLMELLILENRLRGALFERPMDSPRAQSLLLRFYGPLRALREGVSGPGKTVEARAAALFAFMEQGGLKQKLNRRIKRARQSGDELAAERCAQVWGRLVETLDQMVELLGPMELPLKSFIAMLRAGLESVRLKGLPQGGEQVYAGELMRFKAEPGLKALVVLGVNEGVLPAAREDGGLLRDEERALINEAGREARLFLPGMAAREALERFVSYAAFASPSECLLLSCPLVSADGKALTPSPLFGRLQRLFPGLEFEGGLQGDELNWLGSAEGAARALERQLRGPAMRPGEMPPAYAALKTFAPERLEGLRRSLLGPQGAESLPPELARRLYAGGESRTSVSRAESFAHCPFLYFVRYGLRPRELRERAADALDTGNLYHEALQGFVALAAECGGFATLSQAQGDALMEMAAAPGLAKLEGRTALQGGRGRRTLDEMRRTLRRAGRVLTEQLRHSRFLPAKEEAGFGFEQESPIEIELSGEEMLRVAGRIDRLDLFEGKNGKYARIIDYKSGNLKLDLAEVFYGLRLQLFVYLDAVLAMENAKPAGVFYFRVFDAPVTAREYTEEAAKEAILKESRMRGLVLKDLEVLEAMAPPEELGRILPLQFNKDGGLRENASALLEEDFALIRAFTRHKLRQLLERMRAGEIAPSPVSRDDRPQPCAYCDYKGVCRADGSLSGFAQRPIEIAKAEALEKMRLALAEGGQEHA
ncbi:MAG: PD-(D/E)XK nuclease family protein [Christensenellaceae bacterium]|jgi:ATP-dependent helicase/nuclease subunit B|nr:PD-(D/E)XK nuclease family protein [Christensenellaceae bacterium]